MLPKAHRLARQDFLTTKTHGQSHRFPHFSAIIHPNPISHSRFAIVTSSKLAKHAVIRNRLRRQIYEALRTMNYELTNNSDIILFPTRSMLNLTHEDLRVALHPLLQTLSQPLLGP